jgi:hypothetical protein
MSIGRKISGMALALLLTVPAQAGPAMTVRADMVTHSEVLIHGTPARIWPHIVTLEWKQGAKLVATGHAANGANRYKAVMGDATLFDVEDVELVPEQLRTIRLDQPDGALIGYASLKLTPRGGDTIVDYDVYTALALPSAADAVALRKESATRFDQELRALKRIVETGAVK